MTVLSESHGFALQNKVGQCMAYYQPPKQGEETNHLLLFKSCSALFRNRGSPLLRRILLVIASPFLLPKRLRNEDITHHTAGDTKRG